MSAGQRRAHQTAPGAENRREGLRLDRATAGAWAAAGQLRAAGADSELRDLTRYRKAVIQDRTRVVNRLHKTLEDAGIKLASVASDVLGISGRAMLEALVQGTTDPVMLAELARGRLRGKLPALRQALAGRFRGHHAFLIGAAVS